MQHFFCINSVQVRPDPKFWSDLQPGSNPNSTKFATSWIQSNPSPVQCSSLMGGSRLDRIDDFQKICGWGLDPIQFFVSELDSAWRISQSAHLCSVVELERAANSPVFRLSAKVLRPWSLYKLNGHWPARVQTSHIATMLKQSANNF